MAARKGHLFVVSGPSGAGKSTIIERFLAEDRTAAFSVSCTTRKKRANEVEGRDYRFIDESTFKKMIEADGFLEWENVHGYLYGTPVDQIAGPLAEGRDVLLDIDVKGALKVQGKCPEACLIFLEPPSVEELVRRLSLRGEKEIEKRMERVREEMAQKGLFTYTVKNDKVDVAYREFQSIIEKVRGQADGKDHC
jgi:guanylate kinase